MKYLRQLSGLLRPERSKGTLITRARFNDTAFTFRMGASFPGSVNRTHPANIEPALMDSANPIQGYGYACVVGGTSSVGTANTVRGISTSDTAITAIYGVLVRPFPTQSSGLSNAFGADPIGNVAPPTTAGAVDICREGYIMVPVVGTPNKGGIAYVWVAASSGSHVLGGFEASSSGSTITLTNAQFNTPPDANGYAELVVRLLP